MLFTSHYVSINSQVLCKTHFRNKNLHPTMYLLIRSKQQCFILLTYHLHPTMYLLIHGLTSSQVQAFTFTSHYVSINSVGGAIATGGATAFTSHYVSINSPFIATTLFLPKVFTSHYVSINSEQKDFLMRCMEEFTSHYVSINSHIESVTHLDSCHLHPTMYLLIPELRI